jgi:hypothetical protein
MRCLFIALQLGHEVRFSDLPSEVLELIRESSCEYVLIPGVHDAAEVNRLRENLAKGKRQPPWIIVKVDSDKVYANLESFAAMCRWGDDFRVLRWLLYHSTFDDSDAHQRKSSSPAMTPQKWYSLQVRCWVRCALMPHQHGPKSPTSPMPFPMVPTQLFFRKKLPMDHMLDVRLA